MADQITGLDGTLGDEITDPSQLIDGRQYVIMEDNKPNFFARMLRKPQLPPRYDIGTYVDDNDNAHVAAMKHYMFYIPKNDKIPNHLFKPHDNFPIGLYFKNTFYIANLLYIAGFAVFDEVPDNPQKVRVFEYTEAQEYEPGMLKGGKKHSRRKTKKTNKRRTHKSKNRRTHRR
jgi:hypothetical protein